MKLIKNDNTNFTIYESIIDCGLKVTYIIKKGFNKTYSWLGANYGSIDRKFSLNGVYYDTPQGIAHFLEHKLFEMPDFSDAFVKLTNMGAYSNAYTSNTKTCYLVSSTDDIKQPLEVMLDFVYTPFFDEKRVEDEKSIIESEILMYKDHYDYQLILNTMKHLYHDSTLSEDIAGEVEDIKKVTKELLDISYDAFYNPTNMHLVICGDVDHESLNKDINNFMNKFKFNDVDVIRHDNIENSTILANNFTMYENVSVDKFVLAIKLTNITKENRIKEELIYEAIDAIFFSKSSKLYQDLLDKNLVNDQFASYIDAGKKYRCIMIEGISENVDAVKEVLTTFMNELDTKVITKEDLEVFKRKVIGDFYYSQNSLENIVTHYTTYEALGMNYYDTVNAIKDITLDDVNAYLKKIDTKNIVFGTMKKSEK